MALDRALSLAAVLAGVVAFLTVTGDVSAPAVPLVGGGLVLAVLARRVARRHDRSPTLPALSAWLNLLVATALGLALLDPGLLPTLAR